MPNTTVFEFEAKYEQYMRASLEVIRKLEEVATAGEKVTVKIGGTGQAIRVTGTAASDTAKDTDKLADSLMGVIKQYAGVAVVLREVILLMGMYRQERERGAEAAMTQAQAQAQMLGHPAFAGRRPEAIANVEEITRRTGRAYGEVTRAMGDLVRLYPGKQLGEIFWMTGAAAQYAKVTQEPVPEVAQAMVRIGAGRPEMGPTQILNAMWELNKVSPLVTTNMQNIGEAMENAAKLGIPMAEVIAMMGNRATIQTIREVKGSLGGVFEEFLKVRGKPSDLERRAAGPAFLGIAGLTPGQAYQRVMTLPETPQFRRALTQYFGEGPATAIMAMRQAQPEVQAAAIPIEKAIGAVDLGVMRDWKRAAVEAPGVATYEAVTRGRAQVALDEAKRNQQVEFYRTFVKRESQKFTTAAARTLAQKTFERYIGLGLNPQTAAESALYGVTGAPKGAMPIAAGGEQVPPVARIEKLMPPPAAKPPWYNWLRTHIGQDSPLRNIDVSVKSITQFGEDVSDWLSPELKGFRQETEKEQAFWENMTTPITEPVPEITKQMVFPTGLPSGGVVRRGTLPDIALKAAVRMLGADVKQEADYSAVIDQLKESNRFLKWLTKIDNSIQQKLRHIEFWEGKD